MQVRGLLPETKARWDEGTWTRLQVREWSSGVLCRGGLGTSRRRGEEAGRGVLRGFRVWAWAPRSRSRHAGEGLDSNARNSTVRHAETGAPQPGPRDGAEGRERGPNGRRTQQSGLVGPWPRGRALALSSEAKAKAKAKAGGPAAFLRLRKRLRRSGQTRERCARKEKEGSSQED